jgi:hypothetical protein
VKSGPKHLATTTTVRVRIQAVYKSPIHELLVLAQETLRAGRSVWYVGSDGMAMVGMIDASEQVSQNATLTPIPTPGLQRIRSTRTFNSAPNPNPARLDPSLLATP